jgi:hypothetical protein
MWWVRTGLGGKGRASLRVGRLTVYLMWTSPGDLKHKIDSLSSELQTFREKAITLEAEKHSLNERIHHRTDF